jgi:hypothetical protein
MWVGKLIRRGTNMFFEILIKCNHDEDTFYDHYYISEAENIEEVTKRASDFISNYYGDDKGTLLVDHDNIAYRFSEGEVVEILQINETTPEEFLRNRTGKMFLIK